MPTETGMIDCGVKPEKMTPIGPKEGEPSYPTLYINGVKGLESLPDGEFTFSGVGEAVSHSVTKNKSGKSTSIEIKVKKIKVDGETAKEDKSPDVEDRMDLELEKIVAKKTGKSVKAQEDQEMTDDAGEDM